MEFYHSWKTIVTTLLSKPLKFLWLQESRHSSPWKNHHLLGKFDLLFGGEAKELGINEYDVHPWKLTAGTQTIGCL